MQKGVPIITKGSPKSHEYGDPGMPRVCIFHDTETNYGCYTRAESLETHVRIPGDRSAYRLSPAVRSLLKQRLHTNSNRVGTVVSLPG